MKDNIEIYRLTKFHSLRLNRDQVMDLETWFKIYANVSDFCQWGKDKTWTRGPPTPSLDRKHYIYFFFFWDFRKGNINCLSMCFI